MVDSGLLCEERLTQEQVQELLETVALLPVKVGVEGGAPAVGNGKANGLS